MGARLMLNLKNRTEFSFKFAYGRINDVIGANQGDSIGITDRGGTWGHVAFEKACRKAGKKPIFGVELCMVKSPSVMEVQHSNYVTLLAKNNDGLKEVYEWTTIASEGFYHEPRVPYELFVVISDNVIILVGDSPIWDYLPQDRDNVYMELSPASYKLKADEARRRGIKVVAVGDNYYPRAEDHSAYQIVAGRAATNKSTPQHIIDEADWKRYQEDVGHAIEHTYTIAEQCNVTLDKSVMVTPVKEFTLRQLCVTAAPDRGVDLRDKVYKDRMNHELKMIKEKGYDDYFHVVADLCRYAKQHMLVGPARGSSCGSLVCYLLAITDIDPIEYDLLFERFIDINRMDLPDIDIDFPDNKREMVFDYAKFRYGCENVAKLGTVSRYKPPVTIIDTCKALGIPPWEVTGLRDAIITRSDGDARANNCIEDSIELSTKAKNVIDKHPELLVTTEIEGHARHTGQHAAAMLVTAHPVHFYCSVDERTGTAQIDKYDAEHLDMLKIDALGLRTLSVIQDALDQIGWTRDKLLLQKVDQKDAIEVISKGHFAGIFQFEGHSLKSLCRQMVVDKFDDLVAITALARPGPLSSGGAAEFVKRRNGKKQVSHIHPLMEEVTGVTYGIVVYQEQVMQIARKVGMMSWPDVSSLRKAMGKSLGKEFFDKYWDNFLIGAKKNGLSKADAKHIWDSINSMGLWAFNRSHAVAYGMISYWCCLLKARFPLEFAVACLRNAKDNEQVIGILRELVEEGYEYKPFDKDHSLENWTVSEGKLIGGLIGINGIGPKMAADIIDRRANDKKLTPRHHELLDNGKTPYDVVFETDTLWGHIKKGPAQYGVNSNLANTIQVQDDSHAEFVIIAKLTVLTEKDLNEPNFVKKREGRLIAAPTKYLNMTIEDDTGTLMVSIDRYNYERIGLKFMDQVKIGDWCIFKGFNKAGFRKLNLMRFKLLTGNDDYAVK